MKTFPMKPSLAARPYDRSALLSLSDQIIASLRFTDEDKGKARNACRHLTDALSRCHGRTLQHRWRSFEKSIWPLWQEGVGRPCVLWTWGARVIEVVTKLSSRDVRKTQTLVLTFSGFRIARSVPALDQA
jgi:hypothetical protein